MAQSMRSAGTGAGRRSNSRSGASRPSQARGTTPRAGTARTRTLPGRRKAAPQSTSQKLFGAVTGALSGKTASKAKPSSKKGPAGLALLGAGALAALKNKDKIQGMVKGKTSSSGHDSQVVAPASPTTPVTPAATSSTDRTATDNVATDNAPTDNAPTGVRPIE